MNGRHPADAAIAGCEGLLRVTEACLADLAPDARILVVGCGTGTELLHLASHHPGWRFEAVEPAAPMLAVARKRIGEAGLCSHVTFHERPLAGLRVAPCDGATALLVSQHLVDARAAAHARGAHREGGLRCAVCGAPVDAQPGVVCGAAGLSAAR
ncbi:MAG TPA: class I SAM-dependent methyltransferase [Myxococcota bacterium]|nr:class I SAM-dependent methyltransferase [Myxococcota bacterium]